MTKVEIEIQDGFPEKNVLDYFYVMCLQNPELNKFKVKVGETIKERK